MRRRLPKTVTRDEAKAILSEPNTQTTTGARDRAMLLLMYRAGLRVGEVVGLRKRDLAADGAKRNRNFRVREDTRWRGEVRVHGESRSFLFSIPFACFEGYRRRNGPMRVNIVHGETAAWIAKRPWEPRLRFGQDNPADLGWLIFV